MGFASDRHIKLINVTPFFVCIHIQINKKINMADDVFWREKIIHAVHTSTQDTNILQKSSNHTKLLRTGRVT